MLIKKGKCRRTQAFNSPKPYLGYRDGHGMPGAHEPDLTENFDRYRENFENIFDQKDVEFIGGRKVIKPKRKMDKK